MATYNIRRDGEPYIRHASTVLKPDGASGYNVSYNLHPRAKALFEHAGFVDREKVLVETLYALLLEGSAFNSTHLDGTRAEEIPQEDLRLLRNVVANQDFGFIEKNPQCRSARFLIDALRVLFPNPLPTIRPIGAPKGDVEDRKAFVRAFSVLVVRRHLEKAGLYAAGAAH
jgi:hypothetical protein